MDEKVPAEKPAGGIALKRATRNAVSGIPAVVARETVAQIKKRSDICIADDRRGNLSTTCTLTGDCNRTMRTIQQSTSMLPGPQILLEVKNQSLFNENDMS